jgi:2-oxoglutarate ferredoxin oxidoreductase subunit alpha
MSTTQILEQVETNQDSISVVNDFSITVGTINGSGSQTSNLTILRALFKMGIPVSGKNLFPSNIQGLPTWYTIRVNKDGFTARRDEHEIVVAMNPATFAQDLSDVVPGGVFLYADDIKLKITREDIFAYPMPVKQVVKDSDAPSSLRDYVANMVYVGVLAQLLEIDLEAIYQALDFHFKGKSKPIELNYGVIKAAYTWTEENLEKRDPYRVESMDATDGFIMTDGNTAGALGAIYGGVHFVSWYPITPASSMPEALSEYLPILRKDPREPERNTYVIVQAEDELAAIGMAAGAGWSGLRALTATSGPGLSLMSEFAGLAYFAEIPIVVWDIQRVGPSTGLPTRTAQCDLIFTHFLGHGDTENVLLLPGSVNECFEFGWRAFDIAEHFQTPVFVMSDLDFGMNQWMTEPFNYPSEPMDRGKVLWEGDLDRLNGEWGRYRDVDGDGIAYRTLPGNQHPKAAYFTRGTGHDDNARYSEDDKVFYELMERLKRKIDGTRENLPLPVVESMEGARIGMISFGSADPALREARHMLAELGIKTDYLRVRAVPFSNQIEDFLANHDYTYIVEMNRDGQLHKLLSLDFPQQVMKMISVAYIDGLPITARFIFDKILAKEEK